MWVTGDFAGVLDTCTFYGCSVFHLFGCLDVYSAPYEFSYFLLLSFFPIIFRCCLLAFYLLLLATLSFARLSLSCSARRLSSSTHFIMYLAILVSLLKSGQSIKHTRQDKPGLASQTPKKTLL